MVVVSPPRQQVIQIVASPPAPATNSVLEEAKARMKKLAQQTAAQANRRATQTATRIANQAAQKATHAATNFANQAAQKLKQQLLKRSKGVPGGQVLAKYTLGSVGGPKGVGIK
jgi:hypothetical protein